MIGHDAPVRTEHAVHFTLDQIRHAFEQSDQRVDPRSLLALIA